MADRYGAAGFQACYRQIMPGVPLLANMTECGRISFFTAAQFEAAEFEAIGYAVDAMLTRAELYDTIDYAGCEALDRSIVTTVVPQGMPQTCRETRAAK